MTNAPPINTAAALDAAHADITRRIKAIAAVKAVDVKKELGENAYPLLDQMMLVIRQKFAELDHALVAVAQGQVDQQFADATEELADAAEALCAALEGDKTHAKLVSDVRQAIVNVMEFLADPDDEDDEEDGAEEDDHAEEGEE